MKKLTIVLLILSSTWPALFGQQVITARRRAHASGGTPTFVGCTVDSNAGSASPLILSVTPAAGSTLVYLNEIGDGSLVSLTDDKGTPSPIVAPTSWNLGAGQYEARALTGVSGDIHTITANYGGDTGYFTLYVCEVSHAGTIGNNNGGGITGIANLSAIDCGSLTTNAGSLVLNFAMVYDGSQTIVPSTGPPAFSTQTPSGTPFPFANVGYSTALTSATTYTITDAFAASGVAAPYFCLAIELRP